MDLSASLKRMVRSNSPRRFYIVGLPKSVASPGIFETRRAAEVWLKGKAHLLEQIAQETRQIRACMCCRTSFESQGPHNRLCDPCRKRGTSEGSPAAFSFGAITGRRKSA